MMSEHREVRLALPSVNRTKFNIMAIASTNTNTSSSLLTPLSARNHVSTPRVAKQDIMYHRRPPPTLVLYRLILSLVGFSWAWRFHVRSAYSRCSSPGILSLPDPFIRDMLSVDARVDPAEPPRRRSSCLDRILTHLNRLEPRIGGFSWNCGC